MSPKRRKQTVLEELKWDFFIPKFEGCKQSAVGTIGVAVNQGGGEVGQGGKCAASLSIKGCR